ncbi:MAG: hypothetical protein ACE5NM_04750 [Sedimentisphaerales bacterium]
MEVPGFKEIIKKLSVIRYNSSLLVAVIIAVVAIAVFIPTQLISSKLKEQIKTESVSKGSIAQSQSMNAVSREQWKAEQKYQQSYAEDANQIRLIAEQSTQRELLSYKIFPEPTDTSALIFEEFGQRFREGVDELIARINASDCPSDRELERGLQSTSLRRRFGRRRPSSIRSFTRYFRGSYYGRLSDIDATIIDEICREKASSASVYAHPIDISGYEFWREYQQPGRDEAVKDCWYWQLGYWVIEDVFDTIAAMNAGSDSVFTSPVKRLWNVSFILRDRRYGRPRMRQSMRGLRTKRSLEDKPSYVLAVEDGLTKPCTARFCNDDIDVIHFNVTVLVSADAVLPFMQKLCSAKQHKFRGWDGRLEPPKTFKHNQITILESNIQPVDPEGDEHILYRYGEDAVVELDLICEYIFNKAGYDEIKPQLIKDELQAETETGTP